MLTRFSSPRRIFKHVGNEHSELLLGHFVDRRRNAVDDQRRQFEQVRIVARRVGRLTSQCYLEVLKDQVSNVFEHVFQWFSTENPGE